MRNPICSAFWWRLLFATALPFGLLAAGAMSAHASVVTVTGANGANGAPGGAGDSATATTTTPSDPSNTATASGGNGGSVCFSGRCVRPAARGGAGGWANSTATTSISSGAASAEATSFGGRGGGGSSFGFEGEEPGPGGNGGAASSSAGASSATGSASATASSTGGQGGSGYPEGLGGAATAAASATSGTTGSASATASSTDGAGRSASGGAATGSANAKNSYGAVLTAASAPYGSFAAALTNATVGSGSATPLNITAGEAVSNAILTPSGSDVGVGAMSAAYGGSGSALTYEATATFDFKTTVAEALDLNLLSNNPAQIGFDSLDLQVINETTSKSLASLSFTSSSAAETFFKKGQVSLGSVGAGSQSIEIEYMLGYNSGTSAPAGDGFAFTYALVDPPVSAAVPETSTWAMMLVGFAGLAFARCRTSRGRRRLSINLTKMSVARRKLMERSVGSAVLAIAFGPIALAGFATLAKAQTASASWPHYTVTNIGTLGGSESNGYGGVSNNGWVSGDSYLPGNQTEHAALWRPDGMGQYKITDLGTLGGLNSSTGFAQNNSRGLIAGQAQGSQIDPLGEYWGVAYGCGNGSSLCAGYQNLQFGFLWQNGVMAALPTLGGNNSSAAGVNNLGQVAGWAETATKDPSCVPPQVFDYKAVIYGPRRDEVHVLPTYPGDAVAAALMINDDGEAVGASGTCQTPDTYALAVHAVVWRNGSVFNLPGLGGVMNNAAGAINNAGQIVGTSDPTGDATTYAVLWQNGGITNLGVLPGDVTSVANDINAQGQVVGVSCDANFNCRAFLWDHGAIMDLNSLIPRDSPLYLTYGGGINDQGEIAGTAVLKSNPNEQPAFLAIPAPAGQIAGDLAQRMILPENIRASLQRRLRLGRPTTQQ